MTASWKIPYWRVGTYFQWYPFPENVSILLLKPFWILYASYLFALQGNIFGQHFSKHTCEHGVKMAQNFKHLKYIQHKKNNTIWKRVLLERGLNLTKAACMWFVIPSLICLIILFHSLHFDQGLLPAAKNHNHSLIDYT